MKKLINILIIIIIIMFLIIIKQNSYKKEDVNRDGKVDALDLLIVQKTILEDMENKQKESEK